MTKKLERDVFRADGHVLCSMCSREEQQPTYLPPVLFTDGMLAFARAYDGKGDLPRVICRLCQDEIQTRRLARGKPSLGPDRLFDLYRYFINGPRAPFRPTTGCRNS
jgi:hypothetical protein